LLLSLVFQFFCLPFCSAWAESEAPEISPAVQKVVYKAQQLAGNKEYGEAETCLRRYIEKHPEQPHYLVEFTLGNALALMGKEREALSHYHASAGLYPDYTAAWQNMGKVYFDFKEYDPAGDCLLKAYKTDRKRDPSVLYSVAVSYIMADKGDKALPHLEYLTSGKAGPPKTEWLEALMKVSMDLNLKAKGFETVNGLLDNDGNDPRWWKMLAQFYLNEGDHKAGVAALTVYSYLTAMSREEVMMLGDLNCHIGLPLKAAEYYEQALGFDDDPAAYEKLASAYISAHKSARAISILNRALEKRPGPRFWFLLGHVLYSEEEFERSYDAFNQSVRLNREDGKGYLMMGYCALQVGKEEAARAAFEKASRFSKQRKTAEELLGRLETRTK